jgi:hypothetical protein
MWTGLGTTPCLRALTPKINHLRYGTTQLPCWLCISQGIISAFIHPQACQSGLCTIRIRFVPIILPNTRISISVFIGISTKMHECYMPLHLNVTYSPASTISFISRFRQHVRVYTVHSRMSGRNRNGLTKVRSWNFPAGNEEKSENLSDHSRCSARDSNTSLKHCRYADPFGHNSIIRIKILVSCSMTCLDQHPGHNYLSSTHVLLLLPTTRYSSHRYLFCASIWLHLLRNRYSDKGGFVSGLTFLHLSATRYSVTEVLPLLLKFLDW